MHTSLNYMVSGRSKVLYTPFLKQCFTVNRNMTKGREAPYLRSCHSSVKNFCWKRLISAILWYRATDSCTPWTLHHLKSPLASGRRLFKEDKGEKRESILCKETFQMEIMAQKFNPLKLLVTGEVVLYPGVCKPRRNS